MTKLAENIKYVMIGWGARGIEGVNRCRSYLSYQKRKKFKISKFGLCSLIQIWALSLISCMEERAVLKSVLFTIK